MAATGGAVCLGAGDDADDPNVASQLARAVLAEINVLRRNPAGYADLMSDLVDCYKGTVLTYPQSGLEVRTLEGVRSLDDCLNDLRLSAALPTVMLSQAISKSCAEHVADLRGSGECSHLGSDGSTPEERLARAGDHREQCGENVVFGLRSSQEIVYHMLIDDGSSERGHRANLLNPDFRFAGVGFGAHPAAGTSTVILFTDHFRARALSKHALRKNVAEEALGEPADATIPLHHASERHWDKLMQELKPAHLRVPDHLHDSVTAQCKPEVYRQEHRPPPIFTVGSLRPLPSVDPAIIRAFVHRLDADRDGLLEEDELLALSHHKQLQLSPEEIANMFDEVLVKRTKQEKRARGVTWNEICAAVQCQKRYVPVVDMRVKMEGRADHTLTVELEELFRWADGLYAEYGERCPGLAEPPRPSSAGPRNSSGSERIKALNRFLRSIIESPLGEGRLQDEPKVQHFFGAGFLRPEGGDEPWSVVEALCMGCRRLWAFQSRPHRETWLQVIRASGLDPLVPLPEKFAELAMGPTAIEAEASASRMPGRNVARPVEGSSTGMLATSGKIKVRAPPPKVQVRDLQEGGRQAMTASATSMPHWEDKRQHTEALVNQIVDGTRRASCDMTFNDFGMMKGADVTAGAPGGALGAGALGSASEPQLAFTFDARRKFQQVLSNQSRASDERRFLGAEGRTGDASATSKRNRGTGAHSTSAPAGVRGHFHNSTAILAAESGQAWPNSLDVRWDGQHLDHSLMPELRPDPKLSTMAKDERDKQFSCYFSKKPAADLKLEVAKGQARDLKPYNMQPHEFRADAPHRHGKFGRRAFDPQVRDKPVANHHGISEIETKPVDEFRRQQERVDEFLDRVLPRGQSSHFKTHLPKSEMPDKYEEMATRERMPCIVDGGVKRQQLGFFQNRHSDGTDMKLYTRPLGASQMDRKLPLA